jgi:hypothetical protein
MPAARPGKSRGEGYKPAPSFFYKPAPLPRARERFHRHHLLQKVAFCLDSGALRGTDEACRVADSFL